MRQSERSEMVDIQINARGINDHVVKRAMSKVKRHAFVRRQDQNFAYEDRPLPIGWEQTISQPYIVALMTAALRVLPGEKVLEIGTGSGYQTAVLAEIGAQVFTVERVAALQERAKQTLREQGFCGIHFFNGDGYRGWPDESPFDAALITCAADEFPVQIWDQLKEGGRMVLPLDEKGVQSLYLCHKKQGKRETERLCYVRFVPMMHGKKT